MTKIPNLPTAPDAARRWTRGKAVAAQLGVHPKTISRWADQKLIDRFKPSSRVVLYDAGQIHRLIESART